MAHLRLDPLRVGILGLGEHANEWASGLAGRDLEVVPMDSVGALLRAEVGLAVVLAPPDQAAKIAVEIAAQPQAPPAAMIFGPEGQQHPHIRFIRAILEAKNEWERTFDAIVDPVALVDLEGMIRRANVGLAHVLDRPIQEIVAVHYSTLLGSPGEGVGDPIAASLKDGAARTQEIQFEHLPGLQLLSVSPYLDAAGRLQGLVLILKDIKNQKEHRERLAQAARLAAIGQLAAGVAHEINTPLASIALRAESLLKSAQDTRLQAIDAFKNFPRYLKTIDEEIFRCKKIIGALLDFSRVRKPEARLTDLNALAEKAADLVGHQMKLKQISVGLELDPKLPNIHADDGQIRQALIALLMNALDATPSGGRVQVETRREEGRRVSLTVADSGTGIAREHLEKVFTPFFTTKPVGQGTGLGLAICHGIVSAHGGEIRLESVVGEGTRVSLVLPAQGPVPA